MSGQREQLQQRKVAPPQESPVQQGQVSGHSSLSPEAAMAIARKMLAEQKVGWNPVTAESARGMAEQVLHTHQGRAQVAGRTSVESLPDWEPHMRAFDSALEGCVRPVLPLDMRHPHHHHHHHHHHQHNNPVVLQPVNSHAVTSPYPESVMQSEKYSPWLHHYEEEESVPPTPPLIGTPQQRSPKGTAVEVLRQDMRKALEMIKESSRREVLDELERIEEQHPRPETRSAGVSPRTSAPASALPSSVPRSLAAVRRGSSPLHSTPLLDEGDDDFVDMYSCCSEEGTEQPADPHAGSPLAPSVRYEGYDPVAAPQEALLASPQEGVGGSGGGGGSLLEHDTSATLTPSQEARELRATLATTMSLIRQTNNRQDMHERCTDTQVQSILSLQEQQKAAVQQLHELRMHQMKQQQALQEQAAAAQEMLRLQREDIAARQRQAEVRPAAAQGASLERAVEPIDVEQAVLSAKREPATPAPGGVAPITPPAATPPAATVAAQGGPVPSTPVYFTPNGRPYIFDPVSGKSKWLKTTSVASASPISTGNTRSSHSPSKGSGVVQLNIVVK